MFSLGPAVVIDNHDDPYGAAIAAQRIKLHHDRSATAVNYYAGLLQLAGQSESSLRWLNRCLTKHPDNVTSLYLKSLALLRNGDYTEGFRLYENRLIDDSNNTVALTAPQWDGSPTDDCVYVWQEGGYGDAIMAVRFWSDVLARAPNAVLSVHPNLLDLFVRNFNGRIIPATGLPQTIDTQCSLMSLPYILGITLEQVRREPYIQSLNPQHFMHQIKPLAKIGFCWRGSPDNERDATRTMPKKAMMAFGERHDLLSLLPEHMRLVKNWSDTADLVHHLDLVITVDTAVAHLAGAMGKPCWILLTPDTDWRWGCEGETTPWYDSVRLFRMTRHGDWSNLLDRVSAAMS